MRKFAIGVLVGMLLTQVGPAPFTAEFKLSVEEGYNGGGGGVRFINLSGTEAYQPLTFAGDEQLPLTQFLLQRNGKRVRITVEDVQERNLERIIR